MDNLLPVEQSHFELEEHPLSMNYSTFGTFDSAKAEDDDETELLSSFASMMVSSIDTLGESTWNNSSHLSTLIYQTKKEDGVQYLLRRNEHDCFGYLQFHGSVSCIEDVPTELSVVSGKLILYVQTTWGNGNVELADAFLHPLILEALESLFIPVAIIPHHIEGPQSKQLEVTSVGFMDSNHQNLIEPISRRDLSVRPVLESAICYVLKKNDQSIPMFLSDMVQSHTTDSGFVRRAWFGFHDVVPANEEFNSVSGIKSVLFGTFANQVGDPVVEVLYNYKDSSYSALVRHVITKLTSHQIVVYCQSIDERMAARVEISKLSGFGSYERQIAIVQVRKGKVFEPLVHDDSVAAIRQTPLRYVPMTQFQASKSNQCIVDGRFGEASAVLSPRQIKILANAISNGCKEFYDVVGYPILDGWVSVTDCKPPHRNNWKHIDDEVSAELELYSI